MGDKTEIFEDMLTECDRCIYQSCCCDDIEDEEEYEHDCWIEEEIEK